MAIRAIISVAKLTAAEISVQSLSAGSQVTSYAFTANYVNAAAGVNWLNSTASGIYMEPQSKNQMVYENILGADAVFNLVEKPFADSTSGTTDITFVETALRKADSATTSDTVDILFIIGRTFNDTFVSVDINYVDFEKPLTEALASVDAHYSEFIKPVTPDSFTVDGGGTGTCTDYVDRYYMVERYVDSAIPLFEFTKAATDAVATADTYTYSALFNREFNESLDVTDDFDGVATSEDDQTMLLHKQRTDLVAQSELTTFNLDKALTDTATGTELLAYSVSKGFTDTSTFSDGLDSIYFSKYRTDTSVTSDNISSVELSKSISDVVDATDDFYGTANTDDDQTMSFFTSRYDTFSVGDSSNQQAEKQLTDSATNSDSGSLRMTDYCDVNYFTSNYVGTYVTFT